MTTAHLWQISYIPEFTLVSEPNTRPELGLRADVFTLLTTGVTLSVTGRRKKPPGLPGSGRAGKVLLILAVPGRAGNPRGRARLQPASTAS